MGFDYGRVIVWFRFRVQLEGFVSLLISNLPRLHTLCPGTNPGCKKLIPLTIFHLEFFLGLRPNNSLRSHGRFAALLKVKNRGEQKIFFRVYEFKSIGWEVSLGVIEKEGFGDEEQICPNKNGKLINVWTLMTCAY